MVFAAMLGNTLMFTFLAGGVSYDNLANLFAAVGLFLALRLSLRWGMTDFYLLMVTITLGLLTKVTLIPYFILVVICWPVLVATQSSWAGLREIRLHRPRNAREFSLASTCTALVLVNLALYGGNLVQFGNIVPTMTAAASVRRPALFSRSDSRLAALKASSSV